MPVDLANIRRDRERAAREAALHVKQWPDKLNPNAMHYEISGKHVASVQAYINSLVAEVESFACVYSFAKFVGPRRVGDQYWARGVCVVSVEHG